MKCLAFAVSLMTCGQGLAANTPPVAYHVRTWCPPDSNTMVAASYSDPDAAQIWAARVVSNALNGTVTAAGTNFTYTPNSGFRGVDRFQYVVNDGSADSGVATALVQVRDTTNRAGNLIILVVNDLLYPNLSNEVERLKTDLTDEGYTSKVQLFGAGTGVSNLWAYLKGEYDNTNQWLTGAILVGNLPKPNSGAYNDLVYWNMTGYQQSGIVKNFNIWISRFSADGSSFGNEVVLLKRALDANHECRKGISRLPQKAYYYNAIAGNAVWGPHLKDVWSSLVCTNEKSSDGHAAVAKFFPARTDLNCAGADAFVGGGDIFQECSHGGWSVYMDASFGCNDLFRMIAQQRSVIATSCDSAYPGGIVNDHILTRGGGCIFAVGGTVTIYFEDYQVATEWYDGASFRALLAQGETWGNAFLKYYIFQGAGGTARGCTMFYGDLSMPVMVTPPNELPVVTSLIANPAMPLPGQPVSFSFTMTDPDAAATNSPYANFKHQVEWFMNGYNSGINDPTFTTNDNAAAWTNQTYVFSTAGVYNVRVEVMDEWKARGWKELTVMVDTPPVASNDTAIVAAGNSVTIAVTTNDSDAEGQALTLDAVTTAPQHGTAVVVGNSVVYTATNSLWGGADSFVYRVKDAYPYYATGSATVTVTVVADIYPPQVARVWAVDNSNVVWVAWSEPVEAGGGNGGAANVANYTLNFGASVTGAVLQADGKTVKLLTSGLLTGLKYILTVNNVRDCAALPNTVAANSRVAFPFVTLTTTVWFDDALPTGATPGNTWIWVTNSPTPFSGTCAHQTVVVTNAIGNHNFTGATQTLTVKTNDILFTYAYPDPSNLTQEIFFMIRYWSNTYTCAYWGADLIAMPNRTCIGPMPPAGQWTCLEVPAWAVGLEGKTVNGMAFSYWSGRVTFDLTGTKHTNTVAATGGIPNNWLSYYFGSTNAANGGANDDYDHDGMRNRDEYLAGTDPKDAASCLRIKSASAGSCGIRLGFDTVPGALYQACWMSNLTDVAGWQSCSNVVGCGGQALVTLTNQTDRGYFQIRMNP